MALLSLFHFLPFVEPLTSGQGAWIQVSGLVTSMKWWERAGWRWGPSATPCIPLPATLWAGSSCCKSLLLVKLLSETDLAPHLYLVILLLHSKKMSHMVFVFTMILCCLQIAQRLIKWTWLLEVQSPSVMTLLSNSWMMKLVPGRKTRYGPHHEH